MVLHAVPSENRPDDEPTPSGRRYRGLSPEERRADQRRRLVRAAIEEFAARGYHRTSVEDIVRSARTSRTAFYAFFDNREDAMYSALQTSMRAVLDKVRRALLSADPERNITEVGVEAYVDALVDDPAAARIVLLEGIGTSPEVNALRSRIRREVADLVRDLWADYDPEAANSPHAAAISVGVATPSRMPASRVPGINNGRMAPNPARAITRPPARGMRGTPLVRART